MLQPSPLSYTRLSRSLKYTQLNSVEICDISSFNIRIERIIKIFWTLIYPEKKATFYIRTYIAFNRNYGVHSDIQLLLMRASGLDL